MKVLLLGGTGEARELAQLLVSAGVEVVSSLAGRTTDARLPVGEVRSGGFGGAAGLSRWLQDHRVDAVVDATHPFAATMTAHAITASEELGVPLLVLRRPGWTAQAGDVWHRVGTAEAAAALLPQLGLRPFLTIGRQGLAAFATTGLWTLARCVDPPEPRPTWCTLILTRGPYDVPGELRVMRDHGIDILVTKDSGGPATAAKLEAARRLRIPVVLIERPPLPAGLTTVNTTAEVLDWIKHRPR